MKDREEIRSQLTRVFRSVFEDDSIEITDTTTAKDIDSWDSLMHITLVISVEKDFGVRLSAAEVGKLENVGKMLDLLQKKIS